MPSFSSPEIDLKSVLVVALLSKLRSEPSVELLSSRTVIVSDSESESQGYDESWLFTMVHPVSLEVIRSGFSIRMEEGAARRATKSRRF